MREIDASIGSVAKQRTKARKKIERTSERRGDNLCLVVIFWGALRLPIPSSLKLGTSFVASSAGDREQAFLASAEDIFLDFLPRALMLAPSVLLLVVNDFLMEEVCFFGRASENVADDDFKKEKTPI